MAAVLRLRKPDLVQLQNREKMVSTFFDSVYHADKVSTAFNGATTSIRNVDIAPPRATCAMATIMSAATRTRNVTTVNRQKPNSMLAPAGSTLEKYLQQRHAGRPATRRRKRRAAFEFTQRGAPPMSVVATRDEADEQGASVMDLETLLGPMPLSVLD